MSVVQAESVRTIEKVPTPPSTIDRYNPATWPAVLTPEDLALVLDLTVDHITRLCRRGELEHTRWGRWIRISRRVALRAAGYEESEIQSLTVTH